MPTQRDKVLELLKGVNQNAHWANPSQQANTTAQPISVPPCNTGRKQPYPQLGEWQKHEGNKKAMAKVMEIESRQMATKASVMRERLDKLNSQYYKLASPTVPGTVPLPPPPR